MSFFRPLLCAAGFTLALAASLDSPVTLAAEAAALPELPLCPEEALSLLSATHASRSSTAATEDIKVTSDTARYSVEGNANVSGKVVVRQGDRTITADEVHIDGTDRSVNVKGNVEYEDPELKVRGESGDYAGGAAQFEGVQFELPQQPARGTADQFSLDPQGIIRLGKVTYTTCPRGSTDWQIKAANIKLDTKAQNGIARDAKLEFKGVPILYLPWISFPVGSARKSGFLFPSLGSSSRGGLQLSAPYYVNLAPNYDLTLQPTIYSRRGFDYQGDFRYLSESSHGALDANFLPDDRVADRSRSRVRWRDVTELPMDWRVRVDAENVSDAAYFEDFAQGADGTSIAFLPRLLQLSYRDDRWNAGALLRNYQTIDVGLAPLDRPYTELPRLYASGTWTRQRGLPLEYGFDSEVAGFRRNIGVDGWRAEVAPHAELNIEGPGYFLRPGLTWNSTVYKLDDTLAGQASSPSRNLPIASIDAGLLFERAAGSNGSRRVTLEPRLMYLYVPYRAQDQLPVFDTGVPDLNWVELFRTNRYVGSDRIGDANQISAGLTTRLFASSSGARYLSATLGQTFYLEQPRVALPDEPLPDRHSSDLIAQLELKAFKDWNVDVGVQWNHHESQAEKSEIRLQYRPDGSRVVNLGYRFQRDRLEQADVSAAWPVANNWKVYGRMLYSLRDRDAIEQFAGVEYGSCCWGVRAVARHYVSNRTGEHDTGFYLQLELKGLSNVGVAADAFLERAIRGYSPPSQRR
ncbi:MAG TPA: LPS assembly protein LptD [Steroidobacteraceae bacterium]|nr:LPS assembly protein LptD [Steroidobacteraceae bacterium]